MATSLWAKGVKHSGLNENGSHGLTDLNAYSQLVKLFGEVRGCGLVGEGMSVEAGFEASMVPGTKVIDSKRLGPQIKHFLLYALITVFHHSNRKTGCNPQTTSTNPQPG